MKSRIWNNNTIRIIERVCHKWDDMPSFFRYFSHFIQLTQALQSTNAATSFSELSRYILSNKVPHSSYEYTSSSQRSRIFKPTQSNLQASAVESTSQRSRIFKPAQPYLGASTAVCSDSMKRKNSCYEVHGFISLLQSPNLLNRFFSSILLSHLPLVL